VPATAEASTGALSPDGSATASVPAAGVPALLKFTGTTLEGKAFDGTDLAGSPVVFWFCHPRATSTVVWSGIVPLPYVGLAGAQAQPGAVRVGTEGSGAG
jgi:hypothetical protein